MAALARGLALFHPRMRQEPGWPGGHSDSLRLILSVQLPQKGSGPRKITRLAQHTWLMEREIQKFKTGAGSTQEGHRWERGGMSKEWKEPILQRQKAQGQWPELCGHLLGTAQCYHLQRTALGQVPWEGLYTHLLI